MSHGDRPSSAGTCALVFGLLALVCAFLPIVGDLVSVPSALAALVFGFIGLRHHSTGRARRVLPAAIGAILGSLALFVAMMMLVATAA